MIRKTVLLILFLILLIGSATATTSIITDDGAPGTSLQASKQNRVFTTTFLDVPADATNLTFSVYLTQNVYTTAHITVSNTTDYETVSGDNYSTNITGLGATGAWYNITVPDTYNFSGSVMVRVYDGGDTGFKLGIDTVADDSTKKKNHYYDGSIWADKTGSWTYFTRLYYDGAEPPETGTVNVGTYFANTAPAGASLSGGTSGRSFLSFDNRARIRETCNITKMQFYLSTVPSTLYIDFWRKNPSGGFDRVGRTANLSSVAVTGVNTISGINIPVQEGDYLGITMSSGGYFNGMTATGGKLYYADSSGVTTSGYDWINQTSVSDLVFNAALFTDTVDAVFIGNSIIAGHPAHYSYIESSPTHTQPENTISWNFGNLSGLSTQNMGIGGQKTSETLARFTTDAINLHPSTYVVIEGGVNDVSQGIANETILSNIESEVSAVETAGKIPVLFLILPWTAATTAQSDKVNYLNGQYQALTSEYPSIIIVDARSSVGDLSGSKWSIKPAYDADGIHYNAAGYSVLGQAVYNAISGQLTANFEANTTSGNVPLTVKFTDTSIGIPTSWAWDFNGDGVTDSTEQNPIYTYSTAGTYTVNLTATNAGGSDTESKSDYIVTSGNALAQLYWFLRSLIFWVSGAAL